MFVDFPIGCVVVDANWHLMFVSTCLSSHSVFPFVLLDAAWRLFHISMFTWGRFKWGDFNMSFSTLWRFSHILSPCDGGHAIA